MDELVDETIEPDTKKPRVEEVQSTEQEVMDEDDGFATGSVTPEEETTVADGDIAVPAPNTAPARVSLNKYKKPRNDDGSYKEHPYTFLNPDDPNIKLCVCVQRSHTFVTEYRCSFLLLFQRSVAPRLIIPNIKYPRS
jgi:hypothetical protein